MKNYTLRTVTHNDELIDESQLTLMENSMLIVKVPNDYTYELARRTHEFVKATLEGESNILTIYEGVKLQVLDIK